MYKSNEYKWLAASWNTFFVLAGWTWVSIMFYKVVAPMMLVLLLIALLPALLLVLICYVMGW